MILTSLKDYTTLHNGVKMPWFGLGVFKVEDGSEVIDSVKAAIKKWLPQHRYCSNLSK